MRLTILAACLAVASGTFSGSIMAQTPNAAQLASDVEAKVLEWRRDLHQHPELSNREFRTSKVIAKHLESLGLEVQTGIAHTGVEAILKGAKSGPLIGIRRYGCVANTGNGA